MAELIRNVGISEQTFYRWKKQYVGMELDQARQMRQLQDENSGLTASLDPFATSSGGGMGGAASFRDVLDGIKGALLHFLNYTTYSVMKARAGDVSVNGVGAKFIICRKRVHRRGDNAATKATANEREPDVGTSLAYVLHERVLAYQARMRDEW